MDLHDAMDLDETISRVLGFAQRAVPCDFTGVMLQHHGKLFTTAGLCDPRVTQADQLQLDCREGLWLSRSATQHGVLILDTADDPRWPRWGPRVAQLGLRSVLSIRLRTARSELGLVNFYSTSPGRFAAADNSAAYLLACHASIAIAAAQETATLVQAADARTVIGQAQGILMERFALNAGQAFDVLRRYSQDSNTKLHDIARRFVGTRHLPTCGCDQLPKRR